MAPPADVVDDVDGTLRHSLDLQIRKADQFILVNMDDQDGADQEQKLINEGVFTCLASIK
jgi:hypothetical protein